MSDENRSGVRIHRVVIGVGLATLGVLLLLDRSGMLVDQTIGRWWPLILVGLGMARIVKPGRRRRSGLWLVFIGMWLLVDQLDIMAAHDSWPFIIVFAGILIIWRAVADARAPQEDRR